MNTEQLLSALSAIGDDLECIRLLRKIAVALAINGKLGQPPEKLTTSFPQVDEEELPADFKDPTNFTRLGAIARIEKGKTGIKHAALGPFPLVVTGEKRSSCDHFDFDGSAAIVPLVSSAGHGKASINRLHYQEGQFALGTILAAVFPRDPARVTARFIFEYLSTFKDELLVSRMIGSANVSLSIGKIAEVPIPLVSQDAQRRLDELMVLCDRLEAARVQREVTRDRLLRALLHEALQPDRCNEADFESARQQFLERRQAVACLVVQRLHRNKGFGRVRAIKALFLAETHCGVALGGQWGRGDFGPYDHWMLTFESQAVASGWLSCTEYSKTNGGSRIEYSPGPQLSSKAQEAAQALGAEAAEFDRVLNLLANLNTDESEIVATLYAAWNDLLLEGKPVSDDIVIGEFREHWGVARKAEFKPTLLSEWLAWMRKNKLTPKGQGPSTRHQAELI